MAEYTNLTSYDTKQSTHQTRNRTVAEAAWWSPSALAVVDKKGHAHVLRVLLRGDEHGPEHRAADAGGDAGLRFRPLLCTDMPNGRGAYFVCTDETRGGPPTQTDHQPN